jgi:hypothetical protein
MENLTDVSDKNLIQVIHTELREALHHSGGNMNEEVLHLIYQHQLFKCMLPSSLGGLGYGLSHMLEIIEHCAQVDGSLGWLIQIGNGGTYFAPLYNLDTTTKLFGEQNAVLAGSGHVGGTATPVAGGYMVSGTWHHCSGADYATFFTANCKLNDSVIACTFLRDQVTVIQDWDAIGLKQTSTHTIIVNNQFVPHEYVFELGRQKCLREIAALKLPFIAFAQLFFIKVQHGLFQSLIDAAMDLLSKQTEYWSTPRKDTVSDAIQNGQRVLKDFKNEVLQFAVNLETTVPNNEEELKMAKQVALQNRELLHTAQHLLGTCGMQVLYSKHPLSKIYLDMLCVGQHQLLRMCP